MHKLSELLASTTLSVKQMSFNRRLLALLIVALIVRGIAIVSVLGNPEAFFQTDSRLYITPAQNVIAHGIFSQDSAAPYTPDSSRTPGYPAFLMLFMLVWGREPILPVIVAQAIIGGLTVVGSAMLAKRLFDQRTGLVAALLIAFAPMMIIMGLKIMTETLFAALLVLGAILLLKGLDQDRWWLTGLSGLVYGMAAITRPIGSFLLAPLVLIPILHLGRKRLALQLVAMVVGFALLPGAWMARNYAVFGRFALASVSDNNLYYYNVAGSEARRLGISVDKERKLLDARLAAAPPTTDRWPYGKEGAMAQQIILEHPVQFVFSNGLDSLNGFRPGFSFIVQLFNQSDSQADSLKVFRRGSASDVVDELLGQNGIISWLELYALAFTVSLVALAISGLIVLVAARRWPESVLLAAIPAMLLYLPGLASNARFRSIVEPFLAILAAVGFWSLTALLRRARSRPA